MKKLLFVFLTTVGFTYHVHAQYHTDALRYSYSHFGGSARFQATGGAGTSLGGDISSAFFNPAGLGFNRKSEFSISPSLAMIGTDGILNGSIASDNKLNFNINQFGVAFAFPKDGESNDWKGGTFAITFTRINNFHNNSVYSARNSRNSIIDSWIESANTGNVNNSNFTEFKKQLNDGEILSNDVMAYDTYLLNYVQPPAQPGFFDSDVFPGTVNQRERITETGAQNQWNIAYGANYKDFLYVGGGIGVQTLNYERQRTYTETQLSVNPLPNGVIPPRILNGLTLQDNLKQSGTGVNLNVGLILRPVDVWRIGASFTSPTWFTISETYNASLAVSYNNYNIDGKVLGDASSRTVDFVSEVSIRTPLRFNVGTSVIIAKKGFLSIDAEYLDYSSSRLSAEFNLDSDNSRVRNLYTSAINLRGGGELRLDKFRLRAGGALYGNPMKNSDNITKSRLFITGGLGYYNKKNYFDLTLVQQMNTIAYQLYDYSSELAAKIGTPPVAALETSRTNLVFTMGFYF